MYYRDLIKKGLDRNMLIYDPDSSGGPTKSLFFQARFIFGREYGYIPTRVIMGQYSLGSMGDIIPLDFEGDPMKEPGIVKLYGMTLEFVRGFHQEDAHFRNHSFVSATGDPSLELELMYFTEINEQVQTGNASEYLLFTDNNYDNVLLAKA